MAKRSFSVVTSTPTATADAAVLANNTHNGVMQGGAATQRNQISEIELGGQATASAVCIMVAAMNSIAATAIVLGTQGRDAPLDSASADLTAAVDIGRSATIPAQRSATLHLLQLSFNAFGGVIRWVAAPNEEIGMVGLAVNTGSFSLSAFTGGNTGLLSSHIIYESL
ncbi:MAG: hypothetical protein O7D34_02265 [Ignavibacteria bacterium]|nr:hypothetical protein [Ignavibacteria bacterium]